MAKFQLDPSGLAHFFRIAEEARDNALEDIAEEARRDAPVDTGELRASIHVEGNAVVAEADHAVYVELGTRHMDAQPYLTPALYRKRTLRARGL